ncbi:MAG: hypothetical protein DRG63_10665 [Deltaproteobacteria bacterium]|nr:MAG: hypothetical protein DRG63_10665 [Deltaproteobacteria bacterium]RLB21224.1 MAG: hypothetical protein DRG76_09495 [Deltaproteobacteria bacterium]
MKPISQAIESGLRLVFRSKQEAGNPREVQLETQGFQARTHLLNEQEAEKIVNDYGRALEAVNQINREKFSRLITDLNEERILPEEVAQSLEKRKGPYYDLLTMKADASLLPYPKERIREAIEFLLRIDKDPSNISLLKAGLEYLDYFA